ncbi:HAD-IIB family hydrolase [Macrococcoides goetzii]|uniref:HAD-IIB family hydrolase n=1 Tax=Macrococcus TaxID=69965 RepID=UPI001EF2FF62|nr:MULTISPECIES: HAD-IIB family hydrolase [Macrococcus]MCG7418992.1 HAD-IIB family hydrolase [Macrococcus epidermidis]MCH4985581.1 HAD-IIB family hydrolase [Macrococcus sp. PK]
MKSLHFPENVEYLICSDFDETFFAHDLSNPEDVLALDAFLEQNVVAKGILFGIISASTKEMIEACFDKGNYRHYPHFISTNSGTEIYYVKNNKLIRDETYHNKFQQLNFDKSVILNIEEQLKQQNIDLITQTPFENAPFSRNYYYCSLGELDAENIDIIKTTGKKHNFIVNVSKCNPKIGDPENHYDVDFYPSIAGKHAVVQYLMDKFNIDRDHTFAFGDSGNDLLMLNSVKHGYLVSNATEEAKSKYKHHTNSPYNRGILEGLQHYFKE